MCAWSHGSGERHVTERQNAPQPFPERVLRPVHCLAMKIPRTLKRAAQLVGPLAALAAMSAIVPACGGSDSSDGAGGSSGGGYTCSTTIQPKFSSIRSEIFARSSAKGGCVGGQCHDNSTAAKDRGDLRLDTNVPNDQLLADLKKASYRASTLPRVTPGDPSKSFLYLKITNALTGVPCVNPDFKDDKTCGTLMPQDASNALLCEKERTAIKDWITNGANND